MSDTAIELRAESMPAKITPVDMHHLETVMAGDDTPGPQPLGSALSPDPGARVRDATAGDIAAGARTFSRG